jgi:chromosome segregation ATPase
MGKLNVLGAQRVKALIEVLHDKEKEAIAALNELKPSTEEVNTAVYEEFGVTGIKQEIREIKNRLEQLSEELESKTGQTVSLSENYSYYNQNYKRYDKRRKEVRDGEIDKKIVELKQEFRKKEQQLWLCETLEEAKAIVGIE